MTSTPTITISVNEERATKIVKILRALRQDDESISRSEAIGRAIDSFFLTVCPTDKTVDIPESHLADVPA